MPVVTAFPDLRVAIHVDDQIFPAEPEWVAVEFPPVNDIPTDATAITVPDGAFFGINLILRKTHHQSLYPSTGEALVAHIYIDGALVISRLLGPEIFTSPGPDAGFDFFYCGVLVPDHADPCSLVRKFFRFKPFREGGAGEGSIQIVVWQVQRLSMEMAGQKTFEQEDKLRGTSLFARDRVDVRNTMIWKVKKLHDEEPLAQINFRYQCVPERRSTCPPSRSSSRSSLTRPNMPGCYRGVSLDAADGLPEHLSYAMPAPTAPRPDRLSDLEEKHYDWANQGPHHEDDVFGRKESTCKGRLEPNAVRNLQHHGEPDNHHIETLSCVGGHVAPGDGKPVGVKRRSGDVFEEVTLERSYKVAKGAAHN